MKKKFALLIAALLVLSACTSAPPSSSSAPPNGNSSDPPESTVVNVYNWGEYIDEDMIDLFEQETGITVNYQTFESNEQLYGILSFGGVNYVVIIPSDYMASRLIEEDMLEPLNFDNIPNIEKIDPQYLNLEYDPENLYTVPYSWGTTGIIYNSSVITEEVDSWGILFDEQYSGQILMFDNPRDAMGIALLYLGYNVNTTDEAELNAAFDLLQEQRPILQAYVMDQIFDKLESGEAAVGPYYAGDYFTMLENNPDLVFCLPKEGSNYFVDVMCIPKGAENKDNAEKFINFMCRTDVALANMDVTGYSTPSKEAFDSLDDEMKNDPIMFPDEETLARCQVFKNLPKDVLEMYDNFWLTLKA